ncbi:unnamed protein product [Ectocarpus sp. CCAP 1310/34]|nr:unnamed protein product [Ectocarpus sp. CCAP 1310/34]
MANAEDAAAAAAAAAAAVAAAGSTTDTDMGSCAPPSPSSIGSLAPFCDNPAYTSADAMREAIRGMESDLVDLVFSGSSRAPPRELEDWLKVPLEYATASGNLAVVKRLLSAGVGTDPPSNGMRLRLLLHTAAGSGNAGVIEEVLKSGASVDEVDKDRNDRTALHVAAMSGCDAAVRAIASDPRAVVNVADTRGWTPLHIAANAGYRGVVVFLLLKGAKSWLKIASTGDSPLHLAAASNHAGVIEDLLTLGRAPVGMCNGAGQTALHVAARLHRLGACIALLRGGATVGRVCSKGLSCLDTAAWNGHSGQLLQILTAGESPADRKRRCSLALYYAAKANKTDTIRDLVDLGADVNTTRSAGNTNLHCTATRGAYAATQALLQTGANLEIRNNEGATALHRACSFSQSDTVQLLLRWGADETATNYDNLTAHDLVGHSVEEELLSNEALVSKELVDTAIRSMLVNAPADRVWRRRGWLVLCRARWLARVAEKRKPLLAPVASACSGGGSSRGAGAGTGGAAAGGAAGAAAAVSSGKGPANKRRRAKAGGGGARGGGSAASKAGAPSSSGKGKGQAPQSQGGGKRASGARTEGSVAAGLSPSSRKNFSKDKLCCLFGRRENGVAGAGAAPTVGPGVVQPPQLRLGRESLLREGGPAAAGKVEVPGAEERPGFVVAVERLLLLREEGVFRDIVSFL